MNKICKFNSMNEKSSELHFACSTGDVVNAKYLLNIGADINQKNNVGDTPLHYAKNEEIVNLLLENHVNISIKNDEGKTPLINYCMLENKNLAKLLLKNNANINEMCKLNRTALHNTCNIYYRSNDAVLADNNSNQTPITIDLFAIETVKFLIDQKINVDATDIFGATALHYACRYCPVILIQILLLNNANVNQTDNRQKLPLHYAMERNSKEIIKSLFLYETNIDYENSIVQLYYYNLEMDGDIAYVRFFVFYLCKHNYDKMRKFAVLEYYRKYFRYFDEIWNLNDEYISDNNSISYYKFIVIKTLLLSKMLDFKKLKQSKFKNQIYADEFLQKFPIYACIIRRKYDRIENQLIKFEST